MIAVLHSAPGTSRPTAGTVTGVLFVSAAALMNLGPLNDNSFLTHLATGRLILDTGSVPSSDPYTFTATGEPWVVQSWLASVLYASLEAVGGLGAVRLGFGLGGALLAALCWMLLQPAAGVVTRLSIGALLLVIGASAWSERPLMIGLLGFAVVALAAEGRLHPGWLVPVGWLWVNSHGSFPLALVFLAVRWVGSRLDREDGGQEARCLGWLALGLMSGAIGPLGYRALLFPLELLGRQEILSHVVEWRSPAFTSISQRSFLLLAMVGVVGLVRRPRYRDALPIAVFLASALLGSRNIAMASIVLLAPVARAAPEVGTLKAVARPRWGVPVLGLALFLFAAGAAGRASDPDLDLAAYPVASLGLLESNGVDLTEHRLAAREVVGNLMTFVYGPAELVFYDDRFDMFPQAVSSAAVALDSGVPPMLSELDAYDIDLVLVPRASAAGLVLARDAGWRVLFLEDHWQLACRRDVDLGETVGRC